MSRQSFQHKILEILNRDARMPISQLARELRKPRHIVDYHVQQLRKQGVWTETRLRMNYKALGYLEYNVFMRIDQYDEHKDKLAAYLKTNPYVRFAGSLFPQFSIIIAFVVPTAKELDASLDELNILLSEKLIDTKVMRARRFLKFDMFSTRHDPLNTSDTPQKLSKDDLKFLKELNRNPLQTYQELGKACKITTEGARKKLQRFESQNIIQAIYAKINMKKIGRAFSSFSLLQVSNLLQYEKKFIQLLYSDLTFSRTRIISGSRNIQMGVSPANYEEYVKNFRRLESFFGKDLIDYEIYHYAGSLLKKRLPPFMFGETSESLKAKA